MGHKVTMDVVAGVSVDSTGLIIDTSKTGTGARSSVGINSGKVYFEVSVIGNINFGLCDETNDLNGYWPTNESFWVRAVYLSFYIGNITYNYTNPLTISANNPYTVGFALDMDNHILNIYFNGVLIMDSFLLTGKLSNLGTKLYPFLFTGGADNVSHTECNFGATPFKYPMPEGYTAYDGNQSNISKYLLKDDEGYKKYMPKSVATETCVPNMTSNTTPEGEVSCSSYWGDWYPHQAFNNETPINRGWESENEAIAWIQYKFASPKKIVQYYIRGCNDDKWGYKYNPAHWRLEASNDGINYIVLHESFEGSPNILLEKTYTFNNHTSYLYYRLHCLERTGMSWYEINNLKLFEETFESTELISTEFPTEEQFQEKGMLDIPSYSQISGFNHLVTYTTDNLSKSLIKFKPKEKTILSSGVINFSGKTLKKVSLIGTDNARVLFSKDRGTTWYSNVSNKIPIVCATSNSTCYSNATPDKTIDGINTFGPYKYWEVFNTPIPAGQTGHELILDLGEAKHIGKVAIIAGYVSSGKMGVKTFEIFGSNDKSKNKLLYSGEAKNSNETTQNTLCYCSSNESYRYLVLNFKGSYYNETTVLVVEVEVYGSTNVFLSDISTQGLTPAQLTAITPEEWKSFMGDVTSLRFAYYLPDETANTDKLELTVDVIGE